MSQLVLDLGQYMLTSTEEVRFGIPRKFGRLLMVTGWGLGDLNTESHICKHIVSLANVAIIDVAYRLVPENPFPTGILDSFAALQYIASPFGVEQFNINPTKMSIGGVSAGGNIALILAHLARNADIPLRLVAVGTPTVDDLSKYENA
jgi:acetyl esterase/lipase